MKIASTCILFIYQKFQTLSVWHVCLQLSFLKKHFDHKFSALCAIQKACKWRLTVALASNDPSVHGFAIVPRSYISKLVGYSIKTGSKSGKAYKKKSSWLMQIFVMNSPPFSFVRWEKEHYPVQTVGLKEGEKQVIPAPRDVNYLCILDWASLHTDTLKCALLL